MVARWSLVAGWTIAVVAVVAFAALSLLRHRTQVSRGLAHQPLSLVLVKIVGAAVVVLGLTALLSVDRSRNPNFPIQGVPYVLLVVGALLVLYTFLLGRTRYGRHV